MYVGRLVGCLVGWLVLLHNPAVCSDGYAPIGAFVALVVVVVVVDQVGDLVAVVGSHRVLVCAL